MFFKHLIRVLGCLGVIGGLGFMLWLPTRPWVVIKLAVTGVSDPYRWPWTGYEAMLLGNGAIAAVQKTASFIADLNTSTQGAALVQLGASTITPEAQQSLQDAAAQIETYSLAAWIAQGTFLLLPILTIFNALSLMLSGGGSSLQTLKGAFCFILTILAILVLVGGQYVIYQRLEVLLHSAELQQTLQALPAVFTISLENLMEVRLMLMGGGAALLGGLLALLGAGLTGPRNTWVVPPQTYAPMSASNTPLAPTLKLKNSSSSNSSSPPAPTVLLSQTPATSMPICKQCGTELQLNAKFCTRCGAKT